MTNILSAILIEAIFFLSSAIAMANIQLRPVSADFSEFVCSGNKQAKENILRDFGIFDAQIEGEIVRLSSEDNSSGNLTILKSKALTLAKGLGYQGVSFGICTKNKGWIMAFPSPEPLKYKENKIFLPMLSLKSFCRKYSADFIKSNHGRSKTIEIGSGAIAISSLPDGFLGITCLPAKPSWMGPKLWYLFPVGQNLKRDLPGKRIFDGLKSKKDQFFTWVNYIRKNNKLRPLHYPLRITNEMAGALAKTGELTHDRKKMREIRGKLANKALVFLGENRAKGLSIQEIAGLFWNSPKHRDFLLHGSAKQIGLAIKEIPAGFLVVMVLAE